MLQPTQMKLDMILRCSHRVLASCRRKSVILFNLGIASSVDVSQQILQAVLEYSVKSLRPQHHWLERCRPCNTQLGQQEHPSYHSTPMDRITSIRAPSAVLRVSSAAAFFSLLRRSRASNYPSRSSSAAVITRRSSSNASSSLLEQLLLLLLSI